VTTLFNTTTIKATTEIQVLESKDGGYRPYHLASELIGEVAKRKWFFNTRKSRS